LFRFYFLKIYNKTFTVDILVGLIMTTLQEVVLVWCKSCTFSRVRVNEGLFLPEFTPTLTCCEGLSILNVAICDLTMWDETDSTHYAKEGDMDALCKQAVRWWHGLYMARVWQIISEVECYLYNMSGQ
jgi:hypothetical protein